MTMQSDLPVGTVTADSLPPSTLVTPVAATPITAYPPVPTPSSVVTTPPVATQPVPSPPLPAPPAVTSNPLTWLTDFIGSANVQKALGLAMAGITAATAANGKDLGMKITGMTLGGAFTLGVHLIDAFRARIAKL